MKRTIRMRQGLAMRYLASQVGLLVAAMTALHTSGLWAQDLPGLGAAGVEADIELTDENYQAWRDHILPNESEMAWKQIPWLTTFQDGIVAADAAEKPLLLWTMNGHPLGCT